MEASLLSSSGRTFTSSQTNLGSSNFFSGDVVTRTSRTYQGGANVRRNRILRVSSRVGASQFRDETPAARTREQGGLRIVQSRPTSENGAAIATRRNRINLNASSTRQRPSKQQLEREKERAAAAAAAAARADRAPAYSPQGLVEKYSGEPLSVIGRACSITFALGSVAASILVDNQTGQLQRNMRQRARELREALTVLGPTFVKLGQALSTRPDLCPPEYLEELEKLQDSLPTFPDQVAFQLIERELGAPLEDLFESISPRPIAAASLGQVYKAVTRRGGQRLVAVKVQRPGIELAIGLDFFLLRGLVTLVDNYVDSLKTSLVALLDEFATRVYQELDYVQEGRNAERFQSLYGDQLGVYVPEILWECTSTKVLCMEWVEGVKLSDAAQMAQNNLRVLDLVDIGIQCSLRQLLEFGYFHADPHPGNLLAMQDGRLAFLDFGMMSETPPTARYAIIGHVVHLVNRDYEEMARDYYALDFLDESVDVTPIVPALRNFFDDVLQPRRHTYNVLQASVSELNFKTLVDGLGAVLYQYPFNVPAYYALILRSLTVLEGLALYADPNFKVLGAAYPYFAKRLLTDPNPYLRDALIELLFKDGSFRWNRLENLLLQSQKDQEYRSTDAMQPFLALALGPDGAPLRSLVATEAILVTEALLVGAVVESVYPSGVLRGNPNARDPSPSGGLVLSGLLPAPLLFAVQQQVQRQMEQQMQGQALLDMLELRAQVLSCWGLLRSKQSFDISSLSPLIQVIQQAEVQELGTTVASGVLQRLAARALQVLLRADTAEAQKQAGTVQVPAI